MAALRPVLAWTLAVAALICGATLIADRPGLRYEFHPLTAGWDAPRPLTGTGPPQIAGDQDLSQLVSKTIFSLRWRGWLAVDTGGDYRFRVRADQGGYLLLDGERTTRKNYAVTLDPGVYPIEIGFRQTGGESFLSSYWIPPGGEAEPLPAEQLYAARPVRLRQFLRRAVSRLTLPWRRLLGALLVLIGCLFLGRHLARERIEAKPRLTEPPAAPIGKRQVALFGGVLALLFALSWLWTSRFTAPVMGGDDVRYLYKAMFPAKGTWFFNRYVHVYLVKLFTWLRGGDAFLGGPTYWSFMFSTTVVALAVGCRSLGPRWQLRTLVVVLFLLIGAGSILGLPGGAFADYSAMMFVTLTVVVYLHGLSQEETRGRLGWHEVLIGVLTVAAFKSKATGLILVAWMPLLFLWTAGRFDWRGFVRKMAFWAAGVAVGLLVLMSLDAWLLGDFWYVFKPNLGELKGIHVRGEPQIWRSVSGWFGIVWASSGYAGIPSLRYLWLLALAAPILAVVLGKRVELRLLFLLPFAYLLFLIVVYIRAPHVFSMRHLFPVMPLCCLAGGAVAHWLGLEERSWRELLAPRVLVPFVVGAAILVFLVNPLRLQDSEVLSTLGRRMLWPGWILVAIAAALLLRHRARPALLALLVLMLFGPGFTHVTQSLANRYQAQSGELMLYPWRIFGDEIQANLPRTLWTVPEVWNSFGMIGPSATRQTIARIYFHSQDLKLTQTRQVVPDAELAVLAPSYFRTWRRQIAGLREAAIFDPSGNIALVRPRLLQD